jgi:hypothetical protein
MKRALGELMKSHREYHDIWNNPERYLDYEFYPHRDVNPFLHITIDGVVQQQIYQRPFDDQRYVMELRKLEGGR